MGVIIMPYYERGSMEEDALQNGTLDIKMILKHVLENYGVAYEKHGFTHGDLFTKKILLDDKGSPVLIDFEKSRFDRDSTTFWRDVDDLFGDIGRFKYKQELDDVSRVIMINRAYNIPPSMRVIQDLVDALNRLL